MEFFTLLVSGALGLVTPVGLVVDQAAVAAIRSQLAQVEQLQVRVDNAPTHQLLQGKVERVRIAGRSLQLKWQEIRIAALELETDAIELEPRSLGSRPKFKRPLQAGVRLVLTQQDINKLIQSPQFITLLQKLKINTGNSSNTGYNSVYNFVNPNVKFLANNRLSLQVELQEKGLEKPLLIRVESGFHIVGGKNIQLVDPIVAANGEEVPPQFVNAIVNNINKRLDLGNLEDDGLQVRILKLSMRPEELEIAAFLRVEPSSRFLETPGS
ncbi:hypothetical protein SAMD00079811_07350 [Scytonema sp. HK-05]|uniref:LmeA family phospholipid-binding protein n=1 Tax=Scytonema sp. HK-05 TaxID=1137095 RepID=UPI000935E62C|nr:DUF2993 domain-containing protein [Scytonema sp. HK-05]OKH59779.1 hypothetical protein NIES2130_06300 [Scytonema sp. HK-05]BAY43156.1 hypothetical protein SAMD00079811_07350 [Scytonema sp. HK-05]